MADRACIALLDGDRLLFVLQEYRGRSVWTFPGGGLEPGEAPVDAAVREVREEVGVEVAILRLLCQRSRSNAEGTYYCYLGRIISGRPALGSDPELPDDTQELSGWRWAALDEVRDHPEVAPILQLLRAADGVSPDRVDRLP